MKDFTKHESGLFLPNEMEAIAEEAPPNRQTRRQVMAQVKRYNRQQKRLKLRNEKSA